MKLKNNNSRMKKNIFYLLYFFVLLIGISSCITEIEQPKPVLPKDMKAIELMVQTLLPDEASTRATEMGDNDKLNENEVKNLTAFIFDSTNDLLWRLEHAELLVSGAGSASLKVTIVVPLDKVNEYENKQVQILLVANPTIEIPSNIASLEQLESILQLNSDLNITGKKQEKFLMDGKVKTTIHWGDNQVYAVSEPLALKRAASKIRLRIQDIQVKEDGVDYNLEGAPQIKLVSYTRKTSLIEGTPYPVQPADLVSADYQEMVMGNAGGSTYWTTNIPYYAYEHNWRADAENETYLLVKLDLKSSGLAPKSYYYRIPVNYRMPLPGMTPEQKEGLYRLQRNHLYDIISSINLLGNEEEGTPFLLDASIGLQPWNWPDEVDGSIYSAHYLVVKDKKPYMYNVATKEVPYLSDLKVSIKIDKVEYEVYDKDGKHERYVITSDEPTKEYLFVNGVKTTHKTVPFMGGTTVEPGDDLANKVITITHPVPINYVPLQIDFTVTQTLPTSEAGQTPLSEKVTVTQYPPKYITAEKSPGFSGGTSDKAGADFRYHNSIGAKNASGASQVNEMFYKVTTLVNDGNELIGDPTDSSGKTKKDAASNKLVSPQFIIASQHGMSLNIAQYNSTAGNEWVSMNFSSGYGPSSTRFPAQTPYYRITSEANPNNHNKAAFFGHAQKRCEQYFEGEYGTDGYYEELYMAPPVWPSREPVKSKRTVYKTFKYKGHWRIPTSAELEYIDKIQKDENSAVKYLLMGTMYWSAETGLSYNFDGGYWSEVPQDAYIRCVFDTYKLTNHP